MENNCGPSVPPIGASLVLVNEDSRKVELEGEEFTEEEVYHVLVKMEHEGRTNTEPSENEGDIIEPLTVSKDEIHVNLHSPQNQSNKQGERSSCSCQKEIESLKCTVTQLTVQMKKQNEAGIKQKEWINGIKSCLRNFALSLNTFCDDDDDKDDNIKENRDSLQEFSGIVETCESTAIDPVPEAISSQERRETQPEDNSQDGDGENHGPSITIFSYTGNCDSTQVPNGLSLTSAGSPETFLNKVNDELKMNEKQTLNLDEFIFQKDTDKESPIVPDDDQCLEDPDKETEAISKSVKTKATIQCSKCSKSFNLKRSLESHMRRTHPNKTSTIYCHFCKKIFKEAWYLKKHILSVHEGFRYTCTDCPGTFKDFQRLRQHHENVHKEGGPPSQRCKICDVQFLNSKSLQCHLSKVHKNAVFPQKNERLRRKERRVETEKTGRMIFQCHLCPASFPEREHLDSHQRRAHGNYTNVGIVTEKK